MGNLCDLPWFSYKKVVIFQFANWQCVSESNRPSKPASSMTNNQDQRNYDQGTKVHVDLQASGLLFTTADVGFHHGPVADSTTLLTAILPRKHGFVWLWCTLVYRKFVKIPSWMIIFLINLLLSGYIPFSGTICQTSTATCIAMACYGTFLVRCPGPLPWCWSEALEE